MAIVASAPSRERRWSSISHTRACSATIRLLTAGKRLANAAVTKRTGSYGAPLSRSKPSAQSAQCAARRAGGIVNQQSSGATLRWPAAEPYAATCRIASASARSSGTATATAISAASSVYRTSSCRRTAAASRGSASAISGSTRVRNACSASTSLPMSPMVASPASPASAAGSVWAMTPSRARSRVVAWSRLSTSLKLGLIAASSGKRRSSDWQKA